MLTGWNIVRKKLYKEIRRNNMNNKDKESIEEAKQYIKMHKKDIVLMVLGAFVGAYIGYYLWYIDFI